MVKCTKCGTDNNNDANYCRNCGASLNEIDSTTVATSDTFKGGSSECFGIDGGKRRQGEKFDYLGAATAGVILIVLAITYLRYPAFPQMLGEYIGSLVSLRRFVKTPPELLEPAIFFFNVAGVWSLIVSALRVVLQKSVRRAIGDAVGAIYTFFVAFLLSNYSNDVLSAREVGAYLIIGLGLIVVVNAITHFAFNEE